MDHTHGLRRENIMAMVRQLVPGLVLPGLIYFALAGRTGMMTALAAASMVPVLDSVLRLVRGKRPSFVGTAFLGVTGLSIGLAAGLDEPWFIMGKGAALSAVMGVALVLSAGMDRPLTRTVALRLLTDDPESRARLAERWSRPQAVAVFRHLALGWGLWLLASAVQQGAMVMTVSPGVFMAIEPPVRAVLTGLGILASVGYVRRRQQADPELGLLPTRR
jgi:hypothetical protein